MAQRQGRAGEEPEEQPTRQPRDRGKRYQLQLPPPLARKLSLMSAILDMSIPEYVVARLTPIVNRELREALKELDIDMDPDE